MISTHNLSLLPAPDVLCWRLQSLALLDALLADEWQYRYYSFNAAWSESEQMGSMRNGEGDDFFAVFAAYGCFLRGFDHEAAMSPWRETPPKVWPGVLQDVPDEFADLLQESAFHMEDTTFCLWRLSDDMQWSHGPIDFPKGEDDPDGSRWMLSALDGKVQTYRAFAEEYYELDVSDDAIARVFAHEPLSTALLAAFPSQHDLAQIIEDAQEIGYPIQN